MEWISVKERLPKRGQMVLIYTKDDYISVAWLDRLWDNDAMNISTEEVTHWMPLPDPPSGAEPSQGKAE